MPTALAIIIRWHEEQYAEARKATEVAWEQDDLAWACWARVWYPRRRNQPPVSYALALRRALTERKVDECLVSYETLSPFQ